MFTGLVEATGRIEKIDRVDEAEAAWSARRIRIATSLGAELVAGDSVSVSGVCLTVMTADASGFAAIVSPETLRVTTLLTMTEGRVVNLERPLRADARLGGHFVLGHVDAVGRVTAMAQQGDCYWLEVETPRHLGPLMVSKGSIAIDGISLTIATLEGTRVGVQIVPFTFDHTSLRDARAGDGVNLEADVLGKYVARLLNHEQHTSR
jgi:riboflavin synthase